MKIQSVKYQGDNLLLNGIITVPQDSSNRYYKEIQEWVKQGNVVEPEFTKEEILFNKKQELKRQLKNKIQSKITSGFTFGSDVIKTDLVSQQNGQANYSLAMTAMNKAKTYKTNTKYNPMNIILDGGVYYITFNGGTTGATKPTFPTEFVIDVVDNTVSWYKFGLLVAVGAYDANKYFTPQDIESMFIQFNLITTNLRKTYDEYKNKIEVATSIKDLDTLKTEIEGL
jgi:flagellar basal body-associated protein FliL